MNNHKSNLNIENIEFKSDGITLRGRLITPEENVNLPAIKLPDQNKVVKTKTK